MAETFIKKLETFSSLSDDDRHVVRACLGIAHKIAARADIIREGQKPEDVKLISSGFACRYKALANGQRQIVGYLFPGDICDLHVTALDAMDHSIASVSNVSLIRISRGAIATLLARPAISTALLMVTLVNEAINRDWLANVGQRRAEARLAHFLCEWHLRSRAVGLVKGGRGDFPLTQAEIGETLGLSTVHVNRSMKSLTGLGLVAIKSKSLEIPDLAALMKVSGFQTNYLHLHNQRYNQTPAYESVAE